MKNRIFSRIPPVDTALVERLRAFSVADLHEAMEPGRSAEALMASRIRPVVPGTSIVGVAITSFDAPGNNLMMHKALSLAPRGAVLVATSEGRRGALWGELAAVHAARAGVAGVIVDGNVRDVEKLRAMRFPVWASEISALRSAKDSAGAVNVPIRCGDTLVHPGDVIAADDDGVVVVRPDELERVLERAGARQTRENGLRQALERGATLFGEMGLQEVIDRLGIEQVDGHWRPES